MSRQGEYEEEEYDEEEEEEEEEEYEEEEELLEVEKDLFKCLRVSQWVKVRTDPQKYVMPKAEWFYFQFFHTKDNQVG
jgi:hypothetical protein